MNTEEMRELDAWIFQHVFGYIPWREEEYPHRNGWAKGDEYGEKVLDYDKPEFTTSPADALAVLRECYPQVGGSSIQTAFIGQYLVWHGDNFDQRVKADTIELAICLFARQLFEKGEK